MLNVLTMKADGKHKAEEIVKGMGITGGVKKVRRSFKGATKEDKIYELSNKTFAVESKKKIKWVVNMYYDWHCNRVLDPYVPLQIKTANLDLLYTSSEGDLCYSLCRFIKEVKKNQWAGFSSKYFV